MSEIELKIEKSGIFYNISDNTNPFYSGEYDVRGLDSLALKYVTSKPGIKITFNKVPSLEEEKIRKLFIEKGITLI